MRGILSSVSVTHLTLMSTVTKFLRAFVCLLMACSNRSLLPDGSMNMGGRCHDDATIAPFSISSELIPDNISQTCR